MDKTRTSGFALRQGCDRLDSELDTTLPHDIPDPIQRRDSIARVRALRGRLNVWLAIADGQLPRTPLSQDKPANDPPDADNHFGA